MLKRKMKIKENKNTNIKLNISISILLLIVLSFLSIGFALYSQDLLISGVTTLGEQGIFAITNVSLIESSNVKSDSVPAYTDNSIDLNLVFKKDTSDPELESNVFMAKYSITLSNNSFFDFACDFYNYVPNIKDSHGNVIDLSNLSYSIEGLDAGETIKAGETKTIYLTINFVPPDENETYDIEGEIEPELEEKVNGSILASVPSGYIGDLTKNSGNISVPVSISIISSFRADKTANLSIANPDFQIVDVNGNVLSDFVIAGGSTESITAYIKLADGAKFSSDNVTTSMNLTYNDGITVSCGTVKLKVDIDESFIDKKPPIISNVTATIQNATSDNTSNTNVGSIRVAWNVDDEAVDHYTVIIYSVSGSNETELNRGTTTDKYYVFNNLADGKYTFKVFGTDSSEYHNTASQSDIDSATTSPGYCSKSIASNYDWHYIVTTNLTYATESNKTKKVNRGYNFTTTVTKTEDASGCGGSTTYKLPDTITVSMGNVNIGKGTSPGQYQYTGSSSVNSGVITVYGVTGDLTITVKGTAKRS